MGVEIHRYFDGFYKGFLYHIYVTNIDVLCVRMGRDVPAAGYHGGGLVGGLAAAQQQQEALRKYEREVKEETDMLAKRDTEGIRTYIKAMKRGYELDPDDLEDVRIDAVGKWKRF